MINFYHEFTYQGNTDLLIGTEDAIDRMLRQYINENYKIKTLWQVKDIPTEDLIKYSKIRIVN